MVLAATLFTGYCAFNAQNENELTGIALANVEALASDEQTTSGRYRTVGCGGMAFSRWKAYCCYNDDWHNCPSTHTNPNCSPLFGCDD